VLQKASYSGNSNIQQLVYCHHTCIHQVVGLRLALHYPGVPICDVSYIFGNNDKICTALHSYRHIVCPSVSPLSLPLTKSSNLEKNAHVWSWFFPLLCSHS
jgi:hypothetical protein